MLEGKELEGKIGDKGSYSIDVDSALNVEIKVGGGNLETDGVEVGGYAKLTLWKILEKAALATDTKWDDEAISAIKKVFGQV